MESDVKKSDDTFALTNAFLKERLGLTPLSVRYLFRDSDWSAVIKMHAYVEAALNYMIVKALKFPELENVIANLDSSDRKRGKMAFIIALDLLPSKYRSFIHKFSELRNSLVHNAKNIEFSFRPYIKNLDPNKRREFIKAMAEVLEVRLKDSSKEDAEKMAIENPEISSLLCVTGIINFAQGWDIIELLSHELSLKRDESIPKE